MVYTFNKCVKCGDPDPGFTFMGMEVKHMENRKVVYIFVTCNGCGAYLTLDVSKLVVANSNGGVEK